MMSIASLLGILGAALACLSYLGLCRGLISIRGYAMCSLATSLLIGVSFVEQFNVGSAIIQVFFAAVSLHVLLSSKEIPANG